MLLIATSDLRVLLNDLAFGCAKIISTDRDISVLAFANSALIVLLLFVLPQTSSVFPITECTASNCAAMFFRIVNPFNGLRPGIAKPDRLRGMFSTNVEIIISLMTRSDAALLRFASTSFLIPRRGHGMNLCYPGIFVHGDFCLCESCWFQGEFLNVFRAFFC